MSISVTVGEYHLDGLRPAFGPAYSNALPIEHDEDSIYVNPAAMVVGHAYSVQYRDKPALAVKRRDGSVGFYQIPT